MSKLGISSAVLLGLVLMLWHSTCEGAEFYLQKLGPVPLRMDSSRLMVRFDVDVDSAAQAGILNHFPQVGECIDTLRGPDGFGAYVCETDGGYLYFLESLEAIPGVYRVEPAYMTAAGAPFRTGSTFCVQFQQGVTRAWIDSVNSVYHVSVVHEGKGRPNGYLLECTDATELGVVEMANLYFELPETDYSHPNVVALISRDQYKAYDYYNSSQAQLKKVIGTFNQASVWDFAGLTNPITVAVIDDGIAQHEDIPAGRILPGWDERSVAWRWLLSRRSMRWDCGSIPLYFPGR